MRIKAKYTRIALYAIAPQESDAHIYTLLTAHPDDPTKMFATPVPRNNDCFIRSDQLPLIIMQRSLTITTHHLLNTHLLLNDATVGSRLCNSGEARGSHCSFWNLWRQETAGRC